MKHIKAMENDVMRKINMEFTNIDANKSSDCYDKIQNLKTAPKPQRLEQKILNTEIVNNKGFSTQRVSRQGICG